MIAIQGSLRSRLGSFFLPSLPLAVRKLVNGRCDGVEGLISIKGFLFSSSTYENLMKVLSEKRKFRKLLENLIHIPCTCSYSYVTMNIWLI